MSKTKNQPDRATGHWMAHYVAVPECLPDRTKLWERLCPTSAYSLEQNGLEAEPSGKAAPKHPGSHPGYSESLLSGLGTQAASKIAPRLWLAVITGVITVFSMMLVRASVLNFISL